MSFSLKIQLLIAFLTVFCVSVYTFFNLSSQSIDFLKVSREEQLFFSCLVINEIVYLLTVVYSILLCFWSTLTSCWKENTTSSNNFNWTTGCFLLIFIMTNMYIFYTLFIEPINVPDYLKENGIVFLSSILGIILEGIVFTFFRNCVKCEKKKKLLKYTDRGESDDEIV